VQSVQNGDHNLDDLGRLTAALGERYEHYADEMPVFMMLVLSPAVSSLLSPLLSP
jgi:hypothetical protein